MRARHEDFTFHDHQQAPHRFPERDGRQARDAHRARHEGAAREARPRGSVLVWLHEGIQALLSLHRPL